LQVTPYYKPEIRAEAGINAVLVGGSVYAYGSIFGVKAELKASFYLPLNFPLTDHFVQNYRAFGPEFFNFFNVIELSDILKTPTDYVVKGYTAITNMAPEYPN